MCWNEIERIFGKEKRKEMVDIQLRKLIEKLTGKEVSQEDLEGFRKKRELPEFLVLPPMIEAIIGDGITIKKRK